MALTAAELDTLLADLRNQYEQLSREYSEIVDEERREDLSDVLLSIDCQMARLEEQRQDLQQTRSRAKRAGV